MVNGYTKRVNRRRWTGSVLVACREVRYYARERSELEGEEERRCWPWSLVRASGGLSFKYQIVGKMARHRTVKSRFTMPGSIRQW